MRPIEAVVMPRHRHVRLGVGNRKSKAEPEMSYGRSSGQRRSPPHVRAAACPEPPDCAIKSLCRIRCHIQQSDSAAPSSSSSSFRDHPCFCSMQVVWEADTAAFASRKRAARACQKCRAAKKRCHHTFQRPPDQQADTDGLERVLPNLTHKEPIRFVGDLNPESILTDLSSRRQGGPRISRVGTWVEQSRDMQDSLPPEDLGPPPPMKSGEKTPLNVEKYGKVEGGRRTLTGHQRNYLQAVGAFRVLPKATQDAMVTTYIACFDGLLPILNGIKLLKDYSEGRCSIFLMQAICLVTCKTEEAGPYLRLYDDGPLLDPIPFARSLHTGLDAAMKADLEPDRVTKIQILTLMHLHNDGPGGIEDSSLHLSMAIHDAWTSGLHIHTPGRTLKDQSSMLWWTIWTLDKINACLGGRPIVIANRDIDLSRPPLEPTTPRSNVINMWLRLGDLLDDVIEFYRPTADPDCTGWEREFPQFHALSEGLNLDLIHPSEKSKCSPISITTSDLTTDMHRCP